MHPPINGLANFGTDPIQCISWIFQKVDKFDSSRRRRARAFLSALPEEEQPKLPSADARSKLQKLFFHAHQSLMTCRCVQEDEESFSWWWIHLWRSFWWWNHIFRKTDFDDGEDIFFTTSLTQCPTRALFQLLRRDREYLSFNLVFWDENENFFLSVSSFEALYSCISQRNIHYTTLP